MSPKGKLVWSGRRLHLSTMGSGDAGSSAITTAEQSVSPSARTARGNEAEATPNPVLEALADQTSDVRIAQANPDVNPSGNGDVQGFFDPRSGLLQEATQGNQRVGFAIDAQGPASTDYFPLHFACGCRTFRTYARHHLRV